MNMLKKELLNYPIIKLDWGVDVDKIRQFYRENKYKGTDHFGAEISSAVLDGSQYLDTNPEEYWPLNITTLSDEAQSLQETINKTRGISWQEHQKSLSPKRRLRAMLTHNEDYDPSVDERCYTKLMPYAEGSYIQKIMNSFKSNPGRTRFTKLEPNETIHPHVDSVPQHIVRAIIPVWTNDKCLNGYRLKGKDTEMHLELGQVYVINAGLPHWAHNNGKETRVHLIITLDGPKDLLSNHKL